MNVLHVFPPGLLPTSTPDYPEYLLSLHKKNGCGVDVLNLNEVWWDTILSASYLEEYAAKPTIQIKREVPDSGVVERIEKARSILKSDEFFNPESYLWALEQLRQAKLLIQSRMSTAKLGL